MLRVVSPMAGHSLTVHEIPDPVFAAGLVGPGVAIRPRPGPQSALAPIAGTLVKLHPHAYVVTDETGQGVLVHLGIDTVRMQGEGFDLVAGEGSHVEAGDEIVRWDPACVEASGHSAVSAVVALDCDPATVHHRPVGVDVEQGDLLLEVEC
ncbi:MAG TPA: PTS glucose transporter subunit IIA [Nocardioidaceae bacterium]|nr:PTS glucose transporter subunit IIA [Nocardioidaceae bacterium]